MRINKVYILIYAALALGGGSLILFYLFLFFGPFTLVTLGFSTVSALVFDALLCMLFFLQHSILVRRGVRARLGKIIPGDYYGAFYAITSGIALLIMVLFWQRTGTIAMAGGIIYWLLRIIFILCIAGFYRGIVSLGFFDPFGTVTIKLKIHNRKPEALPLTIKGPYRWMRHPLYFFSLCMIWSGPDLTEDKLLFNIMWTIWIIIATLLEERDLLRDFGNGYREYQSRVPMLIPYKIPPAV
ncbi:MAG TPA: isoprenylcysteine carboxylmethyltransferase family protein [Spirochaetota bacterium]|nr:isoprenylcysteine carboxylmethyltransferase family protein [Spirochaetota bacterium]